MLMAADPQTSEASNDEQQIAVIPGDDEDRASVNAAHPKILRLLTPKQRLFARAYVANGGVGRHAAIEAGYSEPDKSATRCLLVPAVSMEIRRLCMLQAEAHLPKAISALVRVMESPQSPAQAVVNAALGIMDRAGLKPKSSPLVAIQNNTYNQASGSAVQDAIAEIWAARTARVSGIAGGMTDEKPRKGTTAHYRAVAEKARAEDREGGDVAEGTPAACSSIPGTPPTPDADPQIEGDGDE